MKNLAAFRSRALAPALLFLLAAQARAGSVTGRVLDPSGKPVAGAKVQWTAYRSDDEGLIDLTLGNEPAVLGETATDASSDESTLFDVQLRAVSAASGRVVDEAGKPVAGARVIAAANEGILD